MTTTPRALSPASVEDAAQAMRDATKAQLGVRLRGGGTKLGWGDIGPTPDLEVTTQHLDRLIEHSPGDLVAIIQAGVPLAAANQAFAGAGQMLALDPPLGEDRRATVGGVVATADSGPLRHCYGAARDLVVGATVVLSDGTVATTGGTVIKNVAGYDLAKLYTGSFGTMGLIVEVVVRLHPDAATHVTTVGASDDPRCLRAAAAAVGHGPLRPESLDVAWSTGHGRVLARFGGVGGAERARRAAVAMSNSRVTVEIEEDDARLWEQQREGQRSTSGVIVRVSAVQTALPAVVQAAGEVSGSMVGRAGLGLFWIHLPPGNAPGRVAAVQQLRDRLHPWPTVILDAPPNVRAALEPWRGDDAAASVFRVVKGRFDPAGTCNRGVLVGGI